MDRKGIIAIALSLVTLVAWMYYNNQEMKKLAAQRAEQQALVDDANKAKEEDDAKKAAAANPTPATPTTPAVPAKPVVEEKTETLQTDSVDYTFTTHGAGIAKVLLKKHEAEKGARMTLNEFGTIPIGVVTETAGQIPDVDFHYALEKDPEPEGITFEGSDARELHLTKKFVVPHSTNMDKDYIVMMRLTYDNRSKVPVTVPGYYVQTGSAAPVHQRDMSIYTGFKYADGKLIDVNWFSGGWFKQAQSTFTASRDQIPWAAVTDQYFSTVVASAVDPKNEAPGNPEPEKRILGSNVWATRFQIEDAEWEKTNHSAEGSKITRYGIEGALGMPGFTLQPGEMMKQSFRIYAGPREYGRLRLLPDGESDVLAFSDTSGIFSFIGPFVGLCSRTLLFSLNSIHAWVGSYAIAIIILTLCIKALLWPMQNKATRSMKRMQLLQPKMTELRDKYKDDPTRMNTEVMKLYKDYGVNPMSGCWPAFVQMPIFFGFYNMLGKAVELRNSKFLWVHDLSQPDTLFHLPGLGFPVNILPLCMAGTMLWQMSASPKTGDKTQQQLFMIMPLVFVMFCYNYASALALYLTVNNLVSVVQLYVTKNQAAPTLEKPPRKKK